MSPPSPPRIRPGTTKRARRKVVVVSECDTCQVAGCRMEDLHKRDELLAVMNDEPKPYCTDRVAPFWERVNNE